MVDQCDNMHYAFKKAIVFVSILIAQAQVSHRVTEDDSHEWVNYTRALAVTPACVLCRPGLSLTYNYCKLWTPASHHSSLLLMSYCYLQLSK